MNQVWFEAENDAEASKLMRKIVDDEINMNELPNVSERNRGIELDFSVSLLECETDSFKTVEY
jgi:hypothetical protein